MKKVFLMLALNVFAISAHAENPAVVFKNNKAVREFNNEKLFESRINLEKEVVNHPKVSALHYNLGVAHENSKEPEKALKEYLSAAKAAEDPELQFQANFNAARLYGEMKDIPNALKYYQAALEINPESQEVKNNIELLFQGNGGGGNNSDKEQESDQKDQQDNNQNQQPQQPQNNQQQKKQAPKPFNSKELSEQDMKKILDELKRQEEQIRAKMNNQKSKETPVEKDW